MDIICIHPPPWEPQMPPRPDFDPLHPTPIFDRLAGEVASLLVGTPDGLTLRQLIDLTGAPRASLHHVLHAPRRRHGGRFVILHRGRGRFGEVTYGLAARYPEIPPIWPSGWVSPSDLEP